MQSLLLYIVFESMQNETIIRSGESHKLLKHTSLSRAQAVACLASSQVCHWVCLVNQSSRVSACSGAQRCVWVCVWVCANAIVCIMLYALCVRASCTCPFANRCVQSAAWGKKVHRRFWRVTAKTCTSCTSGLKSSGLDRVANTGVREREREGESVATTSGRRQLSVRTSVRSLIWHWHAEICGVYVMFAASCLLCLPPLQQPWKVCC